MELLPPSGRRSFDIQLECAPPEVAAGGAEGAKPIKMELSMIAAEEFARVAEHLKAKKVDARVRVRVRVRVRGSEHLKAKKVNPIPYNPNPDPDH